MTLVRARTDFQMLLAVAIAGLLIACNDTQSDVRHHADEGLNRIIKV
jgi:hypothetical protein